jgi:hypothetical protein
MIAALVMWMKWRVYVEIIQLVMTVMIQQLVVIR